MKIKELEKDQAQSAKKIQELEGVIATLQLHNNNSNEQDRINELERAAKQDALRIQELEAATKTTSNLKLQEKEAELKEVEAKLKTANRLLMANEGKAEY